MSWEDEGLCRGATGTWFSEDEAEQEAAAVVCGMCKSLEPCRADALSRGERIGVWGGLIEKELIKLADEREKMQLPAATDGNCACQCIKWHAPIPTSFEGWTITSGESAEVIKVCPATAQAVRDVLDGGAEVGTVSKYAQVLVRLSEQGALNVKEYA